MNIIATLALLVGAWLSFASFAASMSDAPSTYAEGNRNGLIGIMLVFFALAFFGWELFIWIVRAIARVN